MSRCVRVPSTITGVGGLEGGAKRGGKREERGTEAGGGREG